LNLPLSNSRLFQAQCQLGSDPFTGGTGCVNAPPIVPRPQEGLGAQLVQPNERVAVDGAFKTPGLRNVELTAPYFHNGGSLTLMDVVEFYNRGGNFVGLNRESVDPNVVPLGLNCQQRHQLVAFMLALTDDRVRFEQAPFDHPHINLPNFGNLL